MVNFRLMRKKNVGCPSFTNWEKDDYARGVEKETSKLSGPQVHSPVDQV